MERRTLRRLAAGGALLLIAVGAALYLARARGSATRMGAITAVLPRRDARAPDTVRIKVEVLNASTVRGLARRATMHLRDRGFDVLYTGSSSERYDSTVVLDRSGHPEWARIAADAMGGGRVESRPDSSRYLDLTILVGATWRPPPEPLYP
ncbi:MAG TPA: LytR C-terminal domain-containing protein [Gemmatimonadaceae bacterium]|nr:LytR C-terminal domain-containing protein [Gemmatimonadaceae bacterium]